MATATAAKPASADNRNRIANPTGAISSPRRRRQRSETSQSFHPSSVNGPSGSWRRNPARDARSEAISAFETAPLLEVHGVVHRQVVAPPAREELRGRRASAARARRGGPAARAAARRARRGARAQGRPQAWPALRSPRPARRGHAGGSRRGPTTGSGRRSRPGRRAPPARGSTWRRPSSGCARRGRP